MELWTGISISIQALGNTCETPKLYFKTVWISQTHRVELYVQLMSFMCMFMRVYISLGHCLHFLDTVSHRNWSSWVGLQGSAHLWPTQPRVTGMFHHTCSLCGFWGSELRSSGTQCTSGTWLAAISLVPQAYATHQVQQTSLHTNKDAYKSRQKKWFSSQPWTNKAICKQIHILFPSLGVFCQIAWNIRCR